MIRRSHCKNGHLLAETAREHGGKRQCRVCERRAAREWDKLRRWIKAQLARETIIAYLAEE